MDQLLAAAVSESGEQASPMTNPPETPNPAATPASSGTSSQPQRSVTPNRPSSDPLTEEPLEASQQQKEQWAEARRKRKELGPRCEVCQIVKKAGCGTEDANPRCLRHPRRGEDGHVGPAAIAQAPAPKPIPRKAVFKYEGGRCEVCTTIKKGGCGTENAHRRCLKNPRGLQTSMRPLTGDGLDGQEGEPVPTLVEQQRVTLWHPEKKQKLCGMAAPMLKNLEQYLKIHPGWVPIQKIDEGVTAPTAGFIEG